MHIHQTAINWCLVDFKVTCMKYSPDWCIKVHSAGVRNGVVCLDKTNLHLTNLNFIACSNSTKTFWRYLMFFKLAFNQTTNEICCIYWAIDFFHKVCQGTNMVLVTMGNYDSFHAILILDDIAHIRNNDIYAKHIFARERKTRVENDDFVLILEDGHVFTDFTKTAKRDDLEFTLISAIWCTTY